MFDGSIKMFKLSTFSKSYTVFRRQNSLPNKHLSKIISYIFQYIPYITNTGNKLTRCN